MKLRRFVVVVAITAFAAWSQTARSEENKASIFTSPSGAFRIEASGADAWVISTKDPSQKVKVPTVGGSEDSNPDDEFYFSPNDEWIYGGRHVGSCLSAADLYHRAGNEKIDILEDFNSKAWKNAAQLRAIKDDYWGAGDCGMTSFVAWSIDSTRLLIGLLGGEDKRDLHNCYLYFNTGTQKFEVTNYLRKLNTAKSQILACAEPIRPLPSESELKTRIDTLDKKLNETYSAKIEKMRGNDRVPNLRESQRNWLKARDKGLALYLSAGPAPERERRKLQFLADTTAARIESLKSAPAEEEPFDFWERIGSKP